MAQPTIFVSSTFYDLRHIRESVKRFIERLGYLAVLSEEGAVFYDPKTTAAQACLAEVLNVQLFVLIIGGRYGSLVPESNQSVTNAEYQQAIRQKIPVFALIDEGTLHDYALYKANASDPDLVCRLTFPHADDARIFKFIDDVTTRPANNALQPFRSAADIENYLQAQWAGMVHSFLVRQADQERVADSLELIGQVNARVELLTQQILSAVGSALDKVTVAALRRMLVSRAVSDLRYWRLTPTPADIARYPTFDDCVEALGGSFKELHQDESNYESIMISGNGEISSDRLAGTREDYTALRAQILRDLAGAEVSLDDFVKYHLAESTTASTQ